MAGPPDTDGDGIPDDVDACPMEDATGFDTDNNGCIDSVSGTVDLVNALIAEGVIDSILSNSILSKLQNAESSLSKENICTAVNQLEAFKSAIDAQRGKKISDEAADEVITYTDSVIANLLSQLSEGESC